MVKRFFKDVDLILLILSLITFVNSISLFYNLAKYVDNTNASVVVINGGWFWLSMNWLNQFILFIILLIHLTIFNRRPTKKAALYELKDSINK